MRLIISTLILFVLPTTLTAQNDSSKIDLSQYQRVIMGDDTVWTFVFNDFKKVESDWMYRSMVRKVRHTYPYVASAVEILSDLGEMDSDKISRSVKKEARKANKEVKKDFRDAILDMSESEGDVLCKLIYLETGMTAYEIIDKYRGKAKAIYWQSISLLGGADLKQTFDPSEDVLLQRVLDDIDAGKIKLSDKPDNRAQRKKEHEKRMKELKKARKKGRKKTS